MRARRLLMFPMAIAVVALLAGCSNPTAGTATPGAGAVAGAGRSTAGASTAQPSDQSAAQPSQALPATRTLTVTATTTLSTAAPPTGSAAAPTTGSPQSAAPALPPTDLSGEVHGFITAVDTAAGQITVDKVDWFTGAAAAQACAEDGITSTDNNRCSGYYYRNVNPMLRVVAVSPQANIVTLTNGVNPAPSDLATLAGRVAATRGTTIYDFTVNGGVVTDLREIYLP